MNVRTSPTVAALLLAMTLVGCAPEESPTPPPTDGPSPSTSPTTSPTPTTTPTVAPIALPSDCRAILSADVLKDLSDVPLNDPSFGPSGVQTDGSLICVWGDPQADTTGLTTTIGYMRRGEALELLNELATEEGFTCYMPDEGTRCEHTWQNETYPVTDGRTLYWRDDILIDTQYSNLAPEGYTAAIVDNVFD